MRKIENAVEIAFRPNSIYQIIVLKIKEKNENSFFDKLRHSYDTHKIIGTFKVTIQPNGEFPYPNYYLIGEILNITERIELSVSDDIEFVATSFFKVNQYVSFKVESHKYYEFFAAWMIAGKENLLQEFFQISEPIKQKYGRPAPLFKVPFKAINFSSADENHFKPSLGGIVEWDKDSDVEKLTTHPEFKEKAAPLFATSISRIEMLLGYAIDF